MNTKQFILLLIVPVILQACTSEKKYETKTETSNGYTYEYVTNDPLKVRIYTLKNGLKVYLSQYNIEPRIMTSIAIKAGGKFDPANTTGLAHYLEHIMFKGTRNFGTLAWDKEKAYLDSIENMFEHYRTLTDSANRAAYYKQIDLVSNAASALAIANEYDKMVGEIGARGTNAYTTEDRTVYLNDIPANQLENWLTIESDRFREIVPRLFHTELEAVYEEKNRGLDSDEEKAYEALYSAAFKKHPYGTQTVIGTTEHLKNPSITEIKNYFTKYYRPNNAAICLSGDLDYDKTIAMIDKHFGSWEPNPDLKTWTSITEDPITKPIEVTVQGPEGEWLYLGYRFNGRSSTDTPLLRLTDMILSNSKAGLIDINLKQQQKVIEPETYVDYLNDYTIHLFTAKPREGQSLTDVKKLLLEQVELLKKGEFDDWLIEAAINDLKKNALEQSQYNRSRTNDEVIAFTNNITWNDYRSALDDLRKYTKEDIVKFANEHYKENYVVVYKRYGEDHDQKKITKPAITKVDLNKESKSPFHEKLLVAKVEKIQPKFLNYSDDVKKLKMDKNIEVLYTKNDENELFTLYYLFDEGTNNMPKLNEASEYLDYLGTQDMPADEIQKEFYKIGCSIDLHTNPEQTYLVLRGLATNAGKAIQLADKLLREANPDNAALTKMVDGIFKKREDSKKDKEAILFDGLMNYGLYGAKSPFTNVLSNKELTELKAEELTALIKGLTTTQHRILYYGPASESSLVASLNKNHFVPDKLSPPPTAVRFELQDMTKPMVYWTNYNMVQAEVMFVSKGEKFDAARIPKARMFNEYFNGNMSSPVFQELREAQGLAYATDATYGIATDKFKNDQFSAYIGTQADKQAEAMKGMMQLIENFPRSEAGFEVARNALVNKLESERITRIGILLNYENAKRKGLDHDLRKDVYEQIQKMTLTDIESFQKEFIKGRKFNVMVIGDGKKLNLKDLAKYGTVKELSLDEIFGYEKPVKIDLK